jgi:hypothetical protein
VLVTDGSSCRWRHAADAHVPVLLRIAAAAAPAHRYQFLIPVRSSRRSQGRPRADIRFMAERCVAAPPDRPFVHRAAIWRIMDNPIARNYIFGNPATDPRQLLRTDEYLSQHEVRKVCHDTWKNVNQDNCEEEQHQERKRRFGYLADTPPRH